MFAPTCSRCGSSLPAGSSECLRCPGGGPAGLSPTRSLPADGPPASTGLPPAGSTGPRPSPHGPAALDLPARFGRFEVKEWVGEGTFAEVYRGYDPQLDREVALKVAKPGTVGTPKRVRRFLREARAAGNLRHPNIVPLFETGEDGGRHFLVAAFIRGRTLGAVGEADRAAGVLPLRDAARIARRLAEALGYAHTQGVVHRDVKPENVMMDEAGEPLLMDFGLASRADPENGEERLTLQGLAVGTPAYMAPEQARADAAGVGPAADQYALGCTLFELLTGRTPFAGPPEVQLLLHQTQSPPSPRKLRPDVPRDLETICLKCLEKDPGKRYPDCLAAADDMRRWLEDEPISARRPGPVEQLVRWVRRNPGRAAAVAAAVLVLVGAGVAADAVRSQRESDRIAAEKRRADDRIEADQTRQATQRETRAETLAQALATADSAAVPRILAELAEVQDLARPKLLALATQPIETRAGLHGRLAVLADDPGRATELARYLPTCRPDELLIIRAALAPHAGAVVPPLWAVMSDGAAEPGRRVRAAAALAGLAPDDPRWAGLAPGVAEAAVRANPVEFVAWSQALDPIRDRLLPALVRRYPATRDLIRGGKLDESRLVAAASGFDLTANLLARYTADRPADLAEAAVTVDPRHHPLFAEAFTKNRAAVVLLLMSELDRTVAHDWADPPLNPAWAPIPEAARLAAEAGQGLVHDRFAVVQAVPLAEFVPLAKALTPCGYRPVRVRPYAAADGMKVAALWRRDGVGWELGVGLTGEEVRARDDAARVVGFHPADVAGWVDLEAEPRSVGTPAAVLGGAAGWAAANAQALRFAVLWEIAPGGKAVNRLYTGEPYARIQDVAAALRAAQLEPQTVQAVPRPQGGGLLSGVWGTGAGGSISWGRPTATFLTGVPGKTVADVSVVRSADGDPEYAGVWRGEQQVELEQLTDLSSVRHLQRVKELAMAGWRPVGLAVAGADLAASVWHRPAVADAARSAQAQRQANAAAVLLTLREVEHVWPLFRHAPDPTVRSYLIHRAAGVGVDPVALTGRFRAESDVSAKRALLLALGEFPDGAVPAADRAGLTAELLTLYRDHPDPGLRGSIDWLLRQKWGKAAELTAIEADLARRAKGAEPGKSEKNWYVNGEGQTYAVVRGPVEFTLGSPASEREQDVDEPAQRKRISRTFAIAAKEVTVAEFLRFRPDFKYLKKVSPDRDSPIIGLRWYAAAEYCNWLSNQDGIPENQWCYQANKRGVYEEGMTIKRNHLSLTGYRLPTEAEWEYTCRAGAGTAYYSGRSAGLVSYYAWGSKNADDRVWPVGRLKPNDLGLFDTLGNAFEWVEDAMLLYGTGQISDTENIQYAEVTDQSSRLLRGGSFFLASASIRCAIRIGSRPSIASYSFGVRPARTLLE